MPFYQENGQWKWRSWNDEEQTTQKRRLSTPDLARNEQHRRTNLHQLKAETQPVTPVKPIDTVQPIQIPTVKPVQTTVQPTMQPTMMNDSVIQPKFEADKRTNAEKAMDALGNFFGNQVPEAGRYFASGLLNAFGMDDLAARAFQAKPEDFQEDPSRAKHISPGAAEISQVTGQITGTVPQFMGAAGLTKAVPGLTQQALRKAPGIVQKGAAFGAHGAATGALVGTFQTAMDEVGDPERQSFKDHLGNVGTHAGYGAAYGMIAPGVSHVVGRAGQAVTNQLPQNAQNAMNALGQSFAGQVARGAVEGGITGGIVGTGIGVYDAAKSGDPSQFLSTVGQEAGQEVHENIVEAIAFGIAQRLSGRMGGVPLDIGQMKGEIHQRAVNNMDQPTREQYNEMVEQVKTEMEVDDQQAHDVAMEALSQNRPDVLEQAAQEIERSYETSQQTKDRVQIRKQQNVVNKLKFDGSLPQARAGQPELQLTNEQVQQTRDLYNQTNDVKPVFKQGDFVRVEGIQGVHKVADDRIGKKVRVETPSGDIINVRSEKLAKIVDPQPGDRVQVKGRQGEYTLVNDRPGDKKIHLKDPEGNDYYAKRELVSLGNRQLDLQFSPSVKPDTRYLTSQGRLDEVTPDLDRGDDAPSVEVPREDQEVLERLAKPQDFGNLQEGQSVGLKGRSGSYTVVGPAGKNMWKLQTEKGGELTVHKAAIVDSPVQSAPEVNQEETKQEVNLSFSQPKSQARIQYGKSSKLTQFEDRQNVMNRWTEQAEQESGNDVGEVGNLRDMLPRQENQEQETTSTDRGQSNTKEPWQMTRKEFETLGPNGEYTANSPSPLQAQKDRLSGSNDKYLLSNPRVKEDGYGIGTEYEVEEPEGDYVTVYRTVPEGVNIIKPGDYVSVSQKYVQDYMDGGWKNDRDHTPPVKILSAVLPKEDITVLASNELTWTPKDSYKAMVQLALDQGFDVPQSVIKEAGLDVQQNASKETTEETTEEPESKGTQSPFDRVAAFKKKISNLDFTADEVKKHAEWMVKSKDHIISDTFNRISQMEAHKKKRKNTREEMARKYFDQELSRLAQLDGRGVMITFGGDQEQATLKKINSLKDEDIQKENQRTKEERERYKKSFENPETLREFETKKAYKGLTEEEQVRYDELKALQQKEREKEKEATKTVKAFSGEVEYTIEPSKHTKTGEDIWVVKLKDRLESDAFNEMKAKMKAIGGYYNSWYKKGEPDNRGFVFKEDPTELVKPILSGQNVEVENPKATEDYQENQRKKVADKLRDKAAKMQETIDDLRSDRLENTRKRAAEGESRRNTADSMERIMKIMNNIADAIESGEATHLDGISERTHIETLDRILRRRARSIDEQTKERHELYTRSGNPIYRDPTVDDIKGMELPTSKVYITYLEQLVEVLKVKRPSGIMRTVGKLDKIVHDAQKKKENMVDVSRIYDELLKVISVSRNLGPVEVKKVTPWNGNSYTTTENPKDIAENINDNLMEYKRLMTMGLDTNEKFRAGLREYLTYRQGTGKSEEQKQAEEIRKMEQDAVFSKIDGFFPTPKDLVEEMLDQADIQPGMKVLEPSAGKGNIADLIRENHSEAELEVVEWNHGLNQLLEKKGHKVVGDDFLQHTGQYDRIIMNPPFENLADIDHVRHAYDLLNPGGRIVAIMGNGPFFRKDKKAQEFRDFLDEVGGTSEELPERFKKGERSTGVMSRLVVIDKSEVVSNETESGVNEEEKALQNAREYLKGRFESTTDDLNEYRKTFGENVYVGPARTAKHVVDVIADENLKEVSETKIKERIATYDKQIEKIQQKTYERTKKGRAQGGSAGALNRDIQNLDVQMKNAKAARERLVEELERRVSKEADTKSWSTTDFKEGDLIELTDRFWKEDDQAELLKGQQPVRVDRVYYNDEYKRDYIRVVTEEGTPLNVFPNEIKGFAEKKSDEQIDPSSIPFDLLNDEILKLHDERAELMKAHNEAGNTRNRKKYEEIGGEIEALDDELATLRKELLNRNEAKYPELLPLYDQYYKLVEKIDKLNGRHRDPLADLSKMFHLGTVGGGSNASRKVMSKLNRQRQKAMEKSIERAKVMSPLYDELKTLNDKIIDIERGKKAKRDEAKQNREERVRNAQVGDTVIDGVYGEAKVIRVNKKTLTIETPSGYREARDYKLIRDVIKKAAQPEKPTFSGNEVTIKTERGTSIQAHYQLMNIHEPIASHDTQLQANANYPKELQPRNRSRKGSDEQINRIVGQLEPEFLGESPKASEGAPILGPDQVVESGNGRMIALRRAYEQNRADKYRDWLIKNADKFGLDPKVIKVMEKPVLVRVRTSDVDRVQFTKEANESSVSKMSATEQAKSDADKLSQGLLNLFVPDEAGNIVTSSNREFINRFMQDVVGPSERNQYLTSEGSINQEGIARIRNAVFARAYGDVSTIEKLVEDPDNNVKNITNAMLIAAPRVAVMEQEITDGNLHPLGLSQDLAAAVNKLSELRENGDTVENYLNQLSMFGDELSPVSKELLRVLDGYKRSAKKLNQILQSYVKYVETAGNPKQLDIFQKQTPTHFEILTAVIREVEKEDGGIQASLWESSGVGRQGTPKKSLQDLREEAAAKDREQNLGIIAKPFRPKQKQKETSDHAFANEEIEQRYQNATVKKETIWHKVMERLNTFKRQITREFEHLPKTAEFSRLREDLRKLQHQKSVSEEDAVRFLRRITASMKPKQFDLFSRKVILDDLHQEDLLGNALPYGFTSETLAQEKARIDAKVQEDTFIQEALQFRKEVWQAIKDEYIESMEEIGFNVRDRVSKEDYFRHQVLDYAAQDSKMTGTGQKVKTPTSRGFLRKREGSTLDINRDYLQADGEVMMKMLYDIQLAKVVKMVDDTYNKIGEVKAKAKEANSKDWRSFIPEGYTIWQPREGNLFFMQNPKEAAQTMFVDMLREMGASEQEIMDALGKVKDEEGKPVLVMGPKRREFVVKEEVAATLDNLYKDDNQGTFHKSWRWLVSKFKTMALHSPTRFIKYTLRNLTGDFDKTLAGNPGALRKIPRSVNELIPVFSKGGAMTKDMRDWFERGGMQSLFSVQEIGDVNHLKQFINLYNQKFTLNPAKIGKKAWNKYWRSVRITDAFRESIIRYANYLEYLEQIKKNGKPSNFGASIPEEVLALKDPKDMAFKLSNELLIAYDSTSKLGTEMSQTVFPFWRFIEGNMKTYLQLFKNAATDQQLAQAISRKMLGTAVLRTPYLAYQLGSFAVKLSAFSVLITVWNGLFDDEQEDLPEATQNRFYIIIGNPFTGDARDENGKVRYFDRVGVLEDFLEWFGLDTPVKDLQDFLSGRRTLGEIGQDNAMKPVNKLYQAFNPPAKHLFEQGMGMQTFPKMTDPRPIDDRMSYFMRFLGLEKEYESIAYKYFDGKPTAPLNRRDLVDYGSDPGQTAYYDIRDLKRNFMKKIGKGSGASGERTEKSKALYHFKLALRYDDRAGAKRYLQEYILAGGTDQGLTRSLQALDPLYGLQDDEKLVFVEWLTKEEKQKLKKAIEFYQGTLLGPLGK